MFLATYITLWLTVMLLAIAVALLFREHGIMLFHQAANRQTQGPDLGSQLDSLDVADTEASQFDLCRAMAGRMRVVFFASASCPACRKALDDINARVAAGEQLSDIVVVWYGKIEEAKRYSTASPAAIRFVHDERGAIGYKLRIGAVPFAIVVDDSRIVRLKMMLGNENSTDELLSMLKGVHSQEFPVQLAAQIQ